MPDHSPADQKILAILAALQKTLGDDFQKLEVAEIEKVRRILEHGETLVEIARYEEAKGLFWAHWRGIILGLSAFLMALLMIWVNAEKLAGKIARLFS